MTNYPTSLDNLDPTRGTSGQPLSSPNHVTHHQNEDDAIEALQAKVGVNSSAVTSSLDYKLTNASSISPGHKHVVADFSDYAPISSSTGVADANKVVKTNASGLIDSSFGLKFGGDGSDGALVITSGTTTIDLSNTKVLIKNYSSISITGTGKLAFSNPNTNGSIIILKCAGDVTLTSSSVPNIDCSGLGAGGGASVTRSTGGTTNGNSGQNGTGLLINQTGAGGGGSTVGGGGNAGSVLAPQSSFYTTAFSYQTYQAKYPLIFVGAGGGSGSTSSNGGGTGTSGAGGMGGGALIIECNSAINFTTTGGISVAGKDGSNGSLPAGTGAAAAGGGGGGGGYCLVLYNISTAISGSITTSGGAGGTYTENYNDSLRGGGGGGGYNVGNVGVDTGVEGATSGGAGGAGFSLIEQNKNFA